MGGGSGRRQARQAAEQSRVEAETARQQAAIIQKRAQDSALKAQRVLMRSLRSRSAGFFETDFTTGGAGGLLGGGGTLG